MVWIGISRERSQIYLWLWPQKRQRKFAVEKANSSKPGALIPVLAPSTLAANSPLKDIALRLAPPPNHCAIPSSQKLQNIHCFVACSPPGSKRSSYPCPLSAQTHPAHTAPPSSGHFTGPSLLTQSWILKSTCLCVSACQTQVLCVSGLF